jgi:hypothetical protein
MVVLRGMNEMGVRRRMMWPEARFRVGLRDGEAVEVDGVAIEEELANLRLRQAGTTN